MIEVMRIVAFHSHSYSQQPLCTLQQRVRTNNQSTATATVERTLHGFCGKRIQLFATTLLLFFLKALPGVPF